MKINRMKVECVVFHENGQCPEPGDSLKALLVTRWLDLHIEQELGRGKPWLDWSLWSLESDGPG